MTSGFLPSHRTISASSPHNDSTESLAASGEVGTDGKEVLVSGPTGECIRVLVVDDHEIVRKGICTMLGDEADFEVVGQVGNGAMTIALTAQLRPDIVLLDIFLGTINGLDIAQQLLRAYPETRIVMMTGVTDEEHLLRAIRIGVH